jgi:mannose-6-phosphate isomerase-like protein (cupin superfamily)
VWKEGRELMRRRIAVAVGLAILLGAPGQSQEQPGGAKEKLWLEMAPGSHFAPAFGDWEQGGHGKFIRVVAGLKVPFHTHSNEYHGVMISGRMTHLYEDGSVSEVGAGDYWGIRSGVPHGHECVSSEPCMMYTHSSGRYDFNLHQVAAPR